MEFWLFWIFCVLLLIAVVLVVMLRKMLTEARGANTILISQCSQLIDRIAMNGGTLDDISTRLSMIEGKVDSLEMIADRMAPPVFDD